MPKLNTEDFRFRLRSPEQIDEQEWRAIQSLELDAFSHTLPNRSVSEISYLVQWDEPDRFRNSRVDPELAVKTGRLFAGQSFSEPLVATAHAGPRLAGYAYTANNVSGRSSVERWFKMRSHNRRYAWLREVSVHPDFQGRGLAHVLGYMVLERRHDEQPVTAYVWEEAMAVDGLLRAAGFSKAAESAVVKPFGEAAAPARMYRYAAQSTELVRQRVRSLPGAEAALATALSQVKSSVPQG